MSRTLAREAAMSLLYERELNEHPNSDTLLEMNDILLTNQFLDKHGDYIDCILAHFEEDCDAIDALISPYCISWKFNRLNKVDLSILRLAVIEITYLDIPAKVAANEAVELAKKYSTEKSPSFVNGVLASIISQLEQAKAEKPCTSSELI